MFRRSLFLFLIGMGMGLPWFVQDWLASPHGGIDSAEPSWFERTRDFLRGPSGETQPATLASVEESSERDPYPLASKTRRLVEGFFGATGSGGLLPATEPSSTARSEAIVGETEAKLTPELGKLGLEPGDPVVLRLFKEENELEIWMKPSHDPLYTLFKVHRLSISAGRPGPKLREGDGQAPEGFYEIHAGGLRPETRHHLGLDLGYPNGLDRSLGRGGSEIMIHGGSGAAGGFGLAPAAMDEVYTLVDAALRAGEASVQVHLFPFRLSDRRMDEVVEERSRWTDEWVNLKEGYDFFENVRLPPSIDMMSGRYAFRIAGIEDP